MDADTTQCDRKKRFPFQSQAGFPGFPTAHCFNWELCSSLCAKIALSFTWSKRIPQIVALGDGSCYATGFPGFCWTWMDGDAMWTASAAQKLVTGHSELHLGHMPGLEERVGLLRSPSAFQRIKRMLGGNLCNSCWPIHSRGTTVYLTFLHLWEEK